MVDLAGVELPGELGGLFPYTVMKNYRCVPFDAGPEVVCVAVAQPLRGSAVRGPDGRPTHAISAIQDISARKRVEQELHKYSELAAGLSRRLVELQEEERRKLARELHDRVGQNLTALNVNLTVLRSELPSEAAQRSDRRFDDCMKLLEITGDVISNVLAELRPPMLASFGLLASLRWYATQFTQRTGIATHVHGAELSPRLSEEIEIALFRIAQEALSNVTKHAHATEVSILLEERGAHVCLTIVDNGVGFDSAQPRETVRWGLSTMKERAEAVGGMLRVDSAPQRGTRVVAEVGRTAA